MKSLVLACVLSLSSWAMATPSKAPKSCEVNIYFEADGESVALSSALMTTAHTQIVKKFGTKNKYYKTNVESDLAAGSYFFRFIVDSDRHRYFVQLANAEARVLFAEAALPFYPRSTDDALEIVKQGLDSVYTQATASDFFNQCPR